MFVADFVIDICLHIIPHTPSKSQSIQHLFARSMNFELPPMRFVAVASLHLMHLSAVNSQQLCKECVQFWPHLVQQHLNCRPFPPFILQWASGALLLAFRSGLALRCWRLVSLPVPMVGVVLLPSCNQRSEFSIRRPKITLVRALMSSFWRPTAATIALWKASSP